MSTERQLIYAQAMFAGYGVSKWYVGLAVVLLFLYSAGGTVWYLKIHRATAQYFVERCCDASTMIMFPMPGSWVELFFSGTSIGPVGSRG